MLAYVEDAERYKNNRVVSKSRNSSSIFVACLLPILTVIEAITATLQSHVLALNMSENTKPIVRYAPTPKLVGIPTELRLHIHELVILSHCSNDQPALSRTCRTVRSEMLPLFYASYTFHFDIQRDIAHYDGNQAHQIAKFQCWAMSISEENARRITSLSLTLRMLPHIRSSCCNDRIVMKPQFEVKWVQSAESEAGCSELTLTEPWPRFAHVGVHIRKLLQRQREEEFGNCREGIAAFFQLFEQSSGWCD